MLYNNLNTNYHSKQLLDHIQKAHEFKPEKKPPVRTDVNDKAVFLEVPQGKFRREFSTDHPLAAGGTGQYNKEMKAGVTPVNMDMNEKLKKTEAEQQKGNVNKRSNNEQLATASQVQRLTYEAQSKVVDPNNVLDKLRAEQNEVRIRKWCSICVCKSFAVSTLEMQAK